MHSQTGMVVERAFGDLKKQVAETSISTVRLGSSAKDNSLLLRATQHLYKKHIRYVPSANIRLVTGISTST